jgi:hypothetical protein
MPLFPRAHTVIRVQPGGYVDGKWTPAVDGPPVSYVLDVQPARSQDFEQVRAEPGGQSLSGLFVAYGATTAPLKEGDILLYDGARHVCISAPPPRDTLGGDVAHVKYLFTRENEPG